MLKPHVFLFTVMSIVLTQLSWASEKVEREIAERIAPVGEVCLAGDPCAAAAASTSSGPRTGQAIYEASCSACHGLGVAGAPKFADAAAWQPRIDNGIEALYTNSLTGINGMPPKGLCMDCSDDELKSAVDYILESL